MVEPVATWPLDDPTAFDDRPALLMSRADAPVSPALTHEGTWQLGDVFLLATDALAAFLLKEDRAAEAVGWTPERFVEVVAEARRSHAMRNDDVTLVVLPAG